MEFEQPQEDSLSISSHLNVRLPCATTQASQYRQCGSKNDGLHGIDSLLEMM
jgi:hypothetical protein